MRFALALGLIAAGGLLLYELVGVIEVLALALIIALILDPTVNLFVRLRFPRFVALLVVLGCVVVGFGLLGYIVLPLLSEQGSDFLVRAPGVIQSVQQYAADLTVSYPSLGFTGSGVASLNLTDAIQEVIQRAGELYTLPLAEPAFSCRPLRLW